MPPRVVGAEGPRVVAVVGDIAAATSRDFDLAEDTSGFFKNEDSG